MAVEPEGPRALEFAARFGLTGPSLLDKFEVVAREYGVSTEAEGKRVLSLPRTFLLDATGRVRAIYREEGDDLEQVIEDDLAGARESAARPD